MNHQDTKGTKGKTKNKEKILVILVSWWFNMVF